MDGPFEPQILLFRPWKLFLVWRVRPHMLLRLVSSSISVVFQCNNALRHLYGPAETALLRHEVHRWPTTIINNSPATWEYHSSIWTVWHTVIGRHSAIGPRALPQTEETAGITCRYSRLLQPCLNREKCEDDSSIYQSQWTGNRPNATDFYSVDQQKRTHLQIAWLRRAT
jgi:hypothetical protein